MAKPEINTLSSVLASINGFNGTAAGQKCLTGPQLVAAWKKRQRTLKRFSALKLAEQHWEVVYRAAWKLVKRKRINKSTRMAKAVPIAYTHQEELL